MPGGRFDSSKTRVAPVFDALRAAGRDWVSGLLQLGEYGCAALDGSLDLTFVEGHWHPKERCLPPPVSLLSWCIRNAGRLTGGSADDDRRARLAKGDPDLVEEALHLLRTEGVNRAWYIFEGPTCPDAVLLTPDALVVIEGKRTEGGATRDTSWLAGRHQIWRHIDAAWELRGRRVVYGLFIVESAHESSTPVVPQHWQQDSRACFEPTVLESSFPHRSAKEVASISKCYLGVTTWRHVCERFQIDWTTLPEDTSNLGA